MEYLREEHYKIENLELMKKDEYKKFLYINMLCTVVLNGNTPTEDQIAFLNRIICGANCEESMEVYMRRASYTDDKILEDFVDKYRNSKLKYNFVLEGIILVTLGDNSSVNYNYLVELIDILGLYKVEIDYLSLLAKSILMQSSELYKEAREILEDGIYGFDFTIYTKNYLSGVIKNTSKEYYVCGINREELDIDGINFKDKKVIFKNLKLKYEKHLIFYGCESVEFINCDISNIGSTINFVEVGRIEFDRCDIYDIGTRFANLESCGSIFIRNSTFNNIAFMSNSYYNRGNYIQYLSKCVYNTEYFPDGRWKRNKNSSVYLTTFGTFKSKYFNILSSAVFRSVGNCIDNIVIEKTKVSNIYMCSQNTPKSSVEHVVGVFISAFRQPIGNLSIKNCKFSGCFAKGYNGDVKDESIIYCQTPNNYTCENTTVEGGVRFITKFYEDY